MKNRQKFAYLFTFVLSLLAGLVFIQSGAASGVKESATVTFNRDVAPIFFKSCAECHRPGEAAPFSVMTYKETRPWAKSIREKVVNRTMPPWHADPHFGEWANDRRLTQKEIDTITAWVDGGAKEGEAKDLPAAPKFAEGWTIGKPDLVIPMPETFTLEASGPDEYQYFEVDPGFKRDVYVQMAEARPDNRRIVHHIIAFIKPPQDDAGAKPSKEEMEKAKAEFERESTQYQDGFLIRTKADAPIHDNGCQLPNGGAGTDRSAKTDGASNIVWLAAYAPGAPPISLPSGTAVKVPAGAKIIFQMHYSKVAGSVQKDRSSIGLIFAKQLPEKELLVRAVSNTYFSIPAGAENHKVTGCWVVPEDIHVQSFGPHMHMRGKSQRIEAFYPNGKHEILLDVPNYDFSWQTFYEPKQWKAIPKGTRILVTSTFDNSAKNKFNPDPAKVVRWGEPTYDEMMIGFISYTKDGQNIQASLNR
ncbi:MAG: cytochrome c [Acidobacteriota bacterium]|nr:cytochrome c [Acidobacteriota bacterium]